MTKEKIYTLPKDESETEDSKEHEVSIDVYKAFTSDIRLPEEQEEPKSLGFERSRQIMIQFLYRKKDHPSSEKFLLFIHQECKFFFLYNGI